MSWGKKIIVLYMSFVIFMSYMVYRAMQQKDIYLVSKDYYKEELDYESTIQKMQNAKDLSEEVEISSVDSRVNFLFPQECAGSTGNIRLFRPSNANFDISYPLNLNSENGQTLDVEKLPKGLWVVKLNWKKSGKDYYLEQKITI